MKIVNQSVEILTSTSYPDALEIVETAGRTCYKSDTKGTIEGSEKFIRGIIKSGHESVIEHFNISVKFITDRGISHEIVRHRIASYSQESSRYCNYSKDKFGNEITFINPNLEEGSASFEIWKEACENAEKSYLDLINSGLSPDVARSVLPTCTKTEIVCTMNAREWRHFIKLRKDKAAHFEIRELSKALLEQLCVKYPVFFKDLAWN